MEIIGILLCCIALWILNKYEWYTSEKTFSRFNERKKKYPDQPSRWYE